LARDLIASKLLSCLSVYPGPRPEARGTVPGLGTHVSFAKRGVRVRVSKKGFEGEIEKYIRN
jgi:hypothetical protein